ncbi:hypothetical protein D3C87_1139010 [compost metagenome]
MNSEQLQSLTTSQIISVLEDANIYWDGDMTRDELIQQYLTAINLFMGDDILGYN